MTSLLSLHQLDERHGYPKDWVINVSPEPGASETGSAASKATDTTGKSSTTGGVKTKVAVTIRDESDGRTSFGEVVKVRKAGCGSRYGRKSVF